MSSFAKNSSLLAAVQRPLSRSSGSVPGSSSTDSTDFSASPSYFADLPDPAALLGNEQDDPQILVHFKSLLKRDATTKEKALAELYNVLKKRYIVSPASDRSAAAKAPRPSQALLACWTQMYAKLAIDVTNPIRVTAHRIQSVLFASALQPGPAAPSPSDDKKYKSNIVKLLKAIAGTWATSIYDTDRNVATECKASLDGVFSPASGKQDAFYTNFEVGILSYVYDVLNHQTVESLSDARYVTGEDAKFKYDRVVRSCILTLAFLVGRTTPDAPFKSAEAKETFLEIVQEKSFWKLTSANGPIVARASLTSIPKIAKAIPQEILEDKQQDIFSAFIKKPLGEDKDSKKAATPVYSNLEILQALISLTHAYPAIWSLTSSKSSDSRKSSKKSKKSKKDAEPAPEDTQEETSKLSSKAAVSYFARFIKSSTSGAVPPPPQFWHLTMALLLELPAPYSPFFQSSTSIEQFEAEDQKKDADVTRQVSQLILEATSHAAASISLHSTGQNRYRDGRNSDKSEPSAAANAWIFYFALVEKIATFKNDSELANSNEYSSEREAAVKEALHQFNEYLYAPAQVVSGTAITQAVDATILHIVKRISLRIFTIYPELTLAQASSGIETLVSSPDVKAAQLQYATAYFYGLTDTDSEQLNQHVSSFAQLLITSVTENNSSISSEAASPALEFLLSYFPQLVDSELSTSLEKLCTQFFEKDFGASQQTQLVHKILILAKESESSSINPSAYPILAVPQILELGLSASSLFPTLSRFLSFYDILIEDDKYAKLSSFVTSALKGWVDQVSTNESAIPEETVQSYYYALLANGTFTTVTDAISLMDTLILKLVDLEEEELHSSNDSSSSKSKLKTKIKDLILRVRKADAAFAFKYSQSELGKATVTRLWRLAETDAVSKNDGSASGGSIESLISQLDLFSFVSLSDYDLSPEVVLKVTTDLRNEVLESSILDLGILLQRASTILEDREGAASGSLDADLKIKAFESLLFESSVWEKVAFSPIYDSGVPAKLCISPAFSSALFHLDSTAIASVPIFSDEGAAAAVKLINMIMFSVTLVQSFPALFDKASAKTKYATAVGIYYADAILRVLSIDTRALEIIKQGEQTNYTDIVAAILNDSSQFKSSMAKKHFTDVSTLDLIGPKPLAPGARPLTLLEELLRTLWERTASDDAQAFYSFLVLKPLLSVFFAQAGDAISPALLKKVIPSKIVNKLGALAILQSLTYTPEPNNLIAQSFTVLRNNLVGDLITLSKDQVHETRGVYALSLLTPALYSSTEFDDDEPPSKLVGVAPFKFTNLVNRISSSFDDFYDPEYAPFVVQLGYALNAIALTFGPDDLPPASFWVPVMEYVAAALTAASANIGSDEDAGQLSYYYPRAILTSCFTLLNTFMRLYNRGYESLHLDDIDESLENVYNLILDTITVFFDGQQSVAIDSIDAIFSGEILAFFLRSYPTSAFSKLLTSTGTDLSPFYSFFTNADPNFQQIGLIAITDKIEAHQKDVALGFATISNPTHDQVEEHLLPLELLSLSSLPLAFLQGAGKHAAAVPPLTSKDARQYLYAWYTIFRYFDESVFSLRSLFLAQLSDNESVMTLLTFISQYSDILQKGPQKDWDITRFDTRSAKLSVEHLLWHVTFQALNYAGFAAKTWFNSQFGSSRVKAATKHAVATHVSPLLIQTETAAVQKYIVKTKEEEAGNDQDEGSGVEGSEISVSRTGKAISLRLFVEGESMEVAFTIPDEFPLQDVRVAGVRRIGATERQWRSWILFSQAVLLKHYAGSLVAALELFKRNVTLYFAGVTECAICYSVLQEDKSLPSRECGTCHNRFHASCLLRWFKSGSTDSCPLCRTEKAFK